VIDLVRLQHRSVAQLLLGLARLRREYLTGQLQFLNQRPPSVKVHQPIT
jgi:hypothetical protein